MKKFEFYKKNPKTGRVRAGAFYVIDKMNGVDTQKDAIKLFNTRLKEGSFIGIFNDKTEVYIIKELI
jgi:hypothetical protein